MGTKPWGNPEKAKILVIGHDPGLQNSPTIASYCFFADYYFQSKPIISRELSKYGLAESPFNCIRDLTAGQFSDDKILITNLYNEELKPSPRGKTNYIPHDKAEVGLKAIKSLIHKSSVKLIFPMSQQVNYWLQKLGFYATDTLFLEKSEPKPSGVENQPPYYQPRQSGAFKEICGGKYIVDKQYFLFPILHIKSYPLKGNFLTYEENYSNCKKELKELVDFLKARNEL